MTNWPIWKPKKFLRAVKIAKVVANTLFLAEGHGELTPGLQFMMQKNPKAGDYIVEVGEANMKLAPAKEWEAAYQRLDSQKTVVIWDELDGHLKYFITGFNCDHVDGKYIGSLDATDEEQEYITKVVWDGEIKVNLLDKFPIEEVQAGAKVVLMGIVPADRP